MRRTTERKVQVMVTNRCEIANQWIEEHVSEKEEGEKDVVGIQGRHSSKKKTLRSNWRGMDTLQISAKGDHALIMQLQYMNGLPREVRRIINSHKVINVGRDIARTLGRLDV